MMASMLRWLLALIVLLLIAAGGAYFFAGRGAPPAIAITKPDGPVGQQGEIQITVDGPGAKFTTLSVALEQNGQTMPLFSLADPQTATISQPSADRMQIVRPFGKRALPQLQAGSG